jgi:hypothetical protein
VGRHPGGRTPAGEEGDGDDDDDDDDGGGGGRRASLMHMLKQEHIRNTEG